MVSVLAFRAVDRGFESRLGKSKTIKLVLVAFTLVILLSIGIQILEIPICQKNSHVS